VVIPPAAARRVALAAQGFADPRPAGPVGVRHFRRVMDRMSVLQLDSVNVVCRSHYLPVLARLGPYDRDRLDRWLWWSGENAEFLAHEASVTAVEVHRSLRYRMRRGRWQAGLRLEQEQPEYVAAVLDEVAELGPLAVSELAEPGERSGPWWGYSKGKLALEWLYVTGRLAIRERRPSFVTVYDLPERVLGRDEVARPERPEHEAKLELVRLAARSLGVGTAADIADYFRLRLPEARPLLAELVAAGEVEQVAVEGWTEPAYLDPAARWPRRIGARALLSPFDPVVWFRPRAQRLFGFRYRIEIYVPEPKRVHGYYVLPFLLGDELVARVDLKADRAAGRLVARGAYAEAGRAPGPIAGPLAEALAELAGWLGLPAVSVEDRGDLAPALRRALGRARGAVGAPG
jgi:uncharacterized protein YcaQ